MIQEVKEKAVVPGDADMIAWGTVLSTVLTCYLIVHHPTSLISFLFRCGITFMIQILLCLPDNFILSSESFAKESQVISFSMIRRPITV